MHNAQRFAADGGEQTSVHHHLNGFGCRLKMVQQVRPNLLKQA